MTHSLSRLRTLIIDHWQLLIAHCSLFIAGVILIAPLLQTSPLCTDDGALHIFRTVALDRALGDGLLYPRWFPDLAFGYGFPFFNYREPLGYYAIEAIHKLGADFPLALNLVLALGVVGAGQAMLLWVRDLFDEAAGFIAGLVYMAAPYTLIGALTRANQPEVLALALLPLDFMGISPFDDLRSSSRFCPGRCLIRGVVADAQHLELDLYADFGCVPYRVAWYMFRVQHAHLPWRAVPGLRTTHHVLCNGISVRFDHLLLVARAGRRQCRSVVSHPFHTRQ